MSTRFDDWEGEYLAHFGIRGMKWGQRRYQNPDGTLTQLGKERYGNGETRSRLGIKHDLNKLDREQTNARVRADYYERKATRKIAHLEKKIDKDRKLAKEFRRAGSNSRTERKGDTNRDWVDMLNKSINKRQAKIEKINREGVGKKAADYKKLLADSEKMTKRIIANATKKGYSIHSRECIRQVNKGRNAVVNLFGGLAAATTGIGVVSGQYASGKHYKVKKDGLGTVTHKSGRRAGFAYKTR